MTGTEYIGDIGVIGRVLITVPQKNGNGGTGGNAFKDTGKDLAGIGFFSCGAYRRLSGFAAVKFLLDKSFINGDTGGNTVNDDPQGFSVGFPESGYIKNSTE